MKKILAATLAAGLLSTLPAGIAHAADIIVPEPVIEDPIVENVRRAFIAIKAGYGPAFADNDIDADLSALLGPGATVSGYVDNDYILGASIESGVFLTDNFRLSTELTYGYVENEEQVVESASLPAIGAAFGAAAQAAAQNALIGSDEIDGQTFTLQGFVKAAYEVPVAQDFLFLRELRVFGVAGVGFVHFNNNLVLTQANNPAFLGARAEGQDVVLAGKIGAGTVSKLTDRISLTSEYNYLFGEDAELELVTTGGAVVPFELETEAHLFQSGIRISF